MEKRVRSEVRFNCISASYIQNLRKSIRDFKLFNTLQLLRVTFDPSLPYGLNPRNPVSSRSPPSM